MKKNTAYTFIEANENPATTLEHMMTVKVENAKAKYVHAKANVNELAYNQVMNQVRGSILKTQQ